MSNHLSMDKVHSKQLIKSVSVKPLALVEVVELCPAV